MDNFYYKDWALYSKEVKLKNNSKAIRIYFFSKKKTTSGTPVSTEEFKNLNFEVKVNEKTSLPFIKRKV
jgi:hypothetical protein